ncbi:MAG: XRE family transcriptional regulator [Candidatus Peribacteraceae bacterium]|nr:XRE family transcriptional regulator [Candidatus Peribacteraceae bacterium]
MDDNMKKNLGRRIKEQREKLGWSQLELAQKVGKSSPAYIALIESGDRNISSMDLMLISKHLKTPVAELVGEKESELTLRQALRKTKDMTEQDKDKIEAFYGFIKNKDRSADEEDIIGDATKPRTNWAREQAKELREQHGNNQIPVQLNDIISALGIPVQKAELSIDGIAQMDNEGTAFIMYNSKAPEVRQRFTVAHELAHIVLEHIGIGESSQLSNKSQEAEANAFANELLIPVIDLKEFMKTKRNVEEVATRYWVSNDAALLAVMNNRLFAKIKE